METIIEPLLLPCDQDNVGGGGRERERMSFVKRAIYRTACYAWQLDVDVPYRILRVEWGNRGRGEQITQRGFHFGERAGPSCLVASSPVGGKDNNCELGGRQTCALLVHHTI